MFLLLIVAAVIYFILGEPKDGSIMLIFVVGISCKSDAYDPMEKAMVSYCIDSGITREALFGGELVKEYAFTNESKMMANVWKNGDEIVVTAKGSPEHILKICDLKDDARKITEDKIMEMSRPWSSSHCGASVNSVAFFYSHF